MKGAKMLRGLHQKEVIVGFLLGVLLLCLVTLISAPHRDIVSKTVRSAVSAQPITKTKTTSSWRPKSIVKAISTQLSLRMQSMSDDSKQPPLYKLEVPTYLKKINELHTPHESEGPVDIASGEIDYAQLERRTRIVVGLSKYTEQDGVGLIGSVHIHMPFIKIIIYDLGMRSRTRNQVKQLCNVEVRNFDFSVQPSHVKVLRSNAWRLLTFVDCLQEFGSCFMAHPKIRFRAPLSTLYPYIRQHHGIFNMIEPDLSLFNSSHPEMLDYFRVPKKNVTDVKEAPLLSPDGYFIIMNSSALSLSLPKLRTCALKRGCVSPRGASWKGVKTTKGDERTIRHHYDISAISAELYKAYGSSWLANDEVEKKFKRIYTKISEGDFGLEMMWSFHCNPLKREFDLAKIVR
ncbi:uncharacterized protein [Amphiura filiformis]|uniref:uncharacterized protein isoform X2 n=1 Tax=Amphiura filiformis TaxID=82378 RepID=UPI003B20D8E3